jgi:hypothetical protein
VGESSPTWRRERRMRWVLRGEGGGRNECCGQGEDAKKMSDIYIWERYGALLTVMIKPRNEGQA